ncbi:hypothetical protein PSN01_03737 [Micromonospora saelicesensis]|nr:hypothetical protein PSN01_03737 [Micromonospora saelicesensis]
MDVTEFPHLASYIHLTDLLSMDKAQSLSHRAASGFWSRLQATNLGRVSGFREDVAEHVRVSGGPALSIVA